MVAQPSSRFCKESCCVSGWFCFFQREGRKSLVPKSLCDCSHSVRCTMDAIMRIDSFTFHCAVLNVAAGKMIF